MNLLFKFVMFFVSLFVLLSCQVDGYIGKLHGAWQLTGIDYPNGEYEALDSIYYNFQGSVVYLQSFYQKSKGESFGYANVGNATLSLKMTKGDLNPELYKLSSLETDFKISKLEFRHMILNHADTVYIFRRYAW